jgi:hypothetical protein
MIFALASGPVTPAPQGIGWSEDSLPRGACAIVPPASPHRPPSQPPPSFQQGIGWSEDSLPRGAYAIVPPASPHRPPSQPPPSSQQGIDWSKYSLPRGAYAIVLSGGYKDDHDTGRELWYTGEGGQKGGKQVRASAACGSAGALVPA